MAVIREKPKLHWLLLLVAATAVVQSNVNACNNDEYVRSIVQNKIMNTFPYFAAPKGYTGKQFAVLILISEGDCASGNLNIKLVPDPSTLDNGSPVQPGIKARRNYLVARPDTPQEAEWFRRTSREHADKKLVDNIAILLYQYTRESDMFLLYTRMTPCSGCTDELIKLAKYSKQNYKGTPFRLAFSTDPTIPKLDMNPGKNKARWERLERNGFRKVLQVKKPRPGGGQIRHYSTTNNQGNTGYLPNLGQYVWNWMQNMQNNRGSQNILPNQRPQWLQMQPSPEPRNMYTVLIRPIVSDRYHPPPIKYTPKNIPRTWPLPWIRRG